MQNARFRTAFPGFFTAFTTWADLATKANLPTATESALSKLESLGLIRRTAGDGRNVIVSLTEKGLSLAEKSVVPMISAEDSVFDSWTQQEKSQFFSLMEKYKSALEKQFKELELI